MKKVLSYVVSAVITSGIVLGSATAQNMESSLKILKDKGIISGYEDGSLHGDKPITRGEFATILCASFEASVTEQAVLFNDLPKSHWAYLSVQKAVNAGWLSGYDDGRFGPDDNITYEQAVCVLTRVIGQDVGGSYPHTGVSRAIDLGLTEGVTGYIGQNISREQMARLVLNTMNYIADNGIDTDAYTRVPSSVGVVSESAKSAGGGGGGAGNANGAYMMYDDYDRGIPYRNSEEYSSEVENVFKSVYTSLLSTFSIDTDTASYSNLRRFIINGMDIPEGAVRTEELINYFDYSGPEVKPGEVFGVKTEIGACPWNEQNKLAMITVQGEQLNVYKPSNLVFLIDTSGSMYSYNKLPYVKKALAMLLDKLGDNDTVSIVTYASGTSVALEPTSAVEKEKILGVIDSLRANGSTAGASGINLAYDMAEKAKIDGNNRIILCTDGDFNVGISSQQELEKLISEKRQSGIYLSVLGFGMGNYKDNRMETLADKGNGNYAYIDNLREAKKVLVDDMSKTIYTIAKDVKIQVEFNPAKVKSYRLVGYENRVLNNEDFANDKKDAGELGAGSTVTVLYEIVPADGTEKAELKYQESVPVNSPELMTVKVRYKMPDSDESILKEFPVEDAVSQSLSEDFMFASAVSELGMILNNSEYKGTATLDGVIELASRGVGEDAFGLRREFIQLVDLLRYNEN